MWCVASVPRELRAIDAGSVVASLEGQVNAVLAFELGDDDATGTGEGEATATGDGEPTVRPTTGPLVVPPPPPPHAASRDVVMSKVANLRNIAILIVNGAGENESRPCGRKFLFVPRFAPAILTNHSF